MTEATIGQVHKSHYLLCHQTALTESQSENGIRTVTVSRIYYSSQIESVALPINALLEWMTRQPRIDQLRLQ